MLASFPATTTDERRVATAHCITTTVLLSAVLWIGTGARGIADVVGDESLLHEAAFAYEENVAKLRTWVSELEVNDKSKQPPSPGLFVAQTNTHHVWFAYDRDLSAYIVRWRCIASDATDAEGKKHPSWKDNQESGEMAIDSDLYRISIYDPKRDKLAQGPSIAKTVGTQARDSGPFEELLIPIELFQHHGESPPSYWRRIWDGARETKEMNVDLSSNGPEILFRIAVPVHNTIQEYVIDRSKGGMLIYTLSDEPNVKWTTQVALAEIAGVWVPSRIERSRVERGGDGQVVKEHWRELRWTKNLVNVDIPPSQFTVDAFRDGRPARLVDLRTKGVTKLGQPVPQVVATAPAPPAPRGVTLRSALVYAAAFGIPLVLLVWYSWRRLRQP